jgi:hypothetical protein
MKGAAPGVARGVNDLFSGTASGDCADHRRLLGTLSIQPF